MTPIYALYVQHERKAAEELAEAGFEAWAPTYKRLRQPSQRSRQIASLIEAPLYPGYVFARIPPERISHAKACERVIGIVSSNGFPAVIPEDVFGGVVALVLSGRLDERLPWTKARPRGVRRRGLSALNEWFELVGQNLRQAA